jgi:hypothetical protein
VVEKWGTNDDALVVAHEREEGDSQDEEEPQAGHRDSGVLCDEEQEPWPKKMNGCVDDKQKPDLTVRHLNL